MSVNKSEKERKMKTMESEKVRWCVLKRGECVCVSEIEREGKRDRGKERVGAEFQRKGKTDSKEREREREG